MTTVVPPPPPTISAQQSSLPTAVVAKPPPALARFPVGTLIEGNISGEQTKGMFRVNIPQGSFVMKTNAPLPRNAALVLQLVSFGQKAHLQIISINGKPSLLALRQPRILNKTVNGPVAGGTPTSSPVGKGGKASPAPAPAFVALRKGATLTATLLKPPAGPGEGAAKDAAGTKSKINATTPTTAKGTTRAIPSIRTTTALQGGGKPGSTTPAGSSAGAAGKGAFPTANPFTTRAKPVAFPVGSQMKVKVLSLNLASQQSARVTTVTASPARPPTPTALVPGSNITGVVTGKTSLGQPILKTNVGALSLATRTPAPVGSTMTLEITSELTAPRHTPATTKTIREVMIQSRTWPSLEEAMKVLEDISPAIAQQVTNTVIAQPNTRLAANMMFFMSALVGGNISSWIGDGALRTIQRFKPELVEKLKGDFKSLEKMAKEPARGDWRISLIPIYAGEGIEQIRFMTRNLGDEETDENEETEGTRFVVDVNLSHIGRLQLDGLVQDKGKRLDLIVRSDSVLSANMRDDIRGIFRHAGDIANISGGVTFQAGPAGFVEISPEETDRIGLTV